jgi:methylated-DNA-[protein]-cysteine S-methyltransferase
MSGHRYCLFQSPLGWVGLLGTDKGLRQLSFKPTPQEALEELGPALDQAIEDPDSFSGERSCLERYFQGETQALDEIHLDLADAPAFFGAAWTACRGIPPGETRSYSWLAAAAGRPLAARAAGQAMARNPFVLIVPCHRVIASNGDLRGYGAGGLRVKARLLELERAPAGPITPDGPS